MRRFFVQNVFFLLLVNLIVKPVWIFGIDRNVQNFVGHEAYGQYQALFNFSLIFQIFLDFGLQSFNNRAVARSPAVMPTLFPNIILAKACLAVIYFLIVISGGWLTGYRGYALSLLCLLAFAQILNSFVLYLRSNVSAFHRFRTDSVLSVLDRLFMIGICGALLYLPPWKDRFQISWFVIAQIVAYGLSALISLAVCVRLTDVRWRGFNYKKVWLIGKSSLPYALLIFTMAVYLRGDSVLLERLLPNGQEEAGVYAAAYRLLDVANNVTGVLFAGILLPMFGRLLARREPVAPVVTQSVNLLFPVAITATLTAFFWSHPIMELLYVHAQPYDGRVFRVLMIAFPGFCLSYVYATLLTAHGSLRPLIKIALIVLVINLGLNGLLIPGYGAFGAAIACAATHLLHALLVIGLARRIIRVSFPLRWIGQYLVFGMLILLAGWMWTQTNLRLLFQLAGMAGSAAVGMLLCGFVPLQKIRAMWQK